VHVVLQELEDRLGGRGRVRMPEGGGQVLRVRDVPDEHQLHEQRPGLEGARQKRHYVIRRLQAARGADRGAVAQQQHHLARHDHRARVGLPVDLDRDRLIRVVADDEQAPLDRPDRDRDGIVRRRRILLDREDDVPLKRRAREGRRVGVVDRDRGDPRQRGVELRHLELDGSAVCAGSSGRGQGAAPSCSFLLLVPPNRCSRGENGGQELFKLHPPRGRGMPCQEG
jgi:hypothetical protein